MNPGRTQTYHPKQPTSPGSVSPHMPFPHHTQDSAEPSRVNQRLQLFLPLEPIHAGLPLWVPRKEQEPEEGREARSNCYCFSLCVWLCLAFPQSHLLFWFPFSFSSPTSGKTSSPTSLGCWRDELRRSTDSTYTYTTYSTCEAPMEHSHVGITT